MKSLTWSRSRRAAPTSPRMKLSVVTTNGLVDIPPRIDLGCPGVKLSIVLLSTVVLGTTKRKLRTPLIAR